MKVTHDFHIHTSLSLCADESATVENYIDIAKNLGLKKLGFSDHFWDSAIDGADEFYTVPPKQDFEHLSLIKPELEKVKNQGIKVFFGCEAEYDPKHHGVGITEETAEKFDFILVPNSHTHFTLPKNMYEPHHLHADFMINAYEEIINSNVSKYITAIAHPFEAVGCPYPYQQLIDMIKDDQYKKLFDKTAEKGIAFEINISSTQGKTPEQIAEQSEIRMFKLAKECGCKFIFGSDAHNTKKHQIYLNCDVIYDILDLKESDIADIAK